MKRIAITMGDPAGVGPEISIKAAQAMRDKCQPVIIGDRSVLDQCATELELTLDCEIIDCQQISEPVQPGEIKAEYGTASFAYIQHAIAGLKTGKFDAVATAPIAKAAWHKAGIYENGHTEVFAKACNIEDYTMMMWSPRLVVSFVTIHQSLISVPQTITPQRVERNINLLGTALKKISGINPKIAVLGINPHAGEAGAFGDEDQRLIEPAIQAAKAQGWDVTGPLPADAAFMPHNRERFDGFVTMYHDQGCIPFKMISLEDGVNTTLGLPIIRTSVDHGTAFDIAWKNKAFPNSLIAAMQLAIKLSSAS